MRLWSDRLKVSKVLQLFSGTKLFLIFWFIFSTLSLAWNEGDCEMRSLLEVKTFVMELVSFKLWVRERERVREYHVQERIKEWMRRLEKNLIQILPSLFIHAPLPTSFPCSRSLNFFLCNSCSEIREKELTGRECEQEHRQGEKRQLYEGKNVWSAKSGREGESFCNNWRERRTRRRSQFYYLTYSSKDQNPKTTVSFLPSLSHMFPFSLIPSYFSPLLSYLHHDAHLLISLFTSIIRERERERDYEHHLLLHPHHYDHHLLPFQ